MPTVLVVASETVATDHGRRARERFRSEVPSAEVVELDSGHDLLADAPEETTDVVAKLRYGSRVAKIAWLKRPPGVGSEASAQTASGRPPG